MPLLFFVSMCPSRASDGICKYAGFGYFYLPAVISTILTIPTVRKIRAYYKGKRCNAIFIVSHLIRISHFLWYPHAVPSHKVIQIRPCSFFFICALQKTAKLGKYPLHLFLCREQTQCPCGVQFIKKNAAIVAGQTVKRKNIPMLLYKSPYLRFFPAPGFPRLKPHRIFHIERSMQGKKPHFSNHLVPCVTTNPAKRQLPQTNNGS